MLWSLRPVPPRPRPLLAVKGSPRDGLPMWGPRAGPLVHVFSYSSARVGNAVIGGLSRVHGIRVPDVVAEWADRVPETKDTDVVQAKSEGKVL